MVDKHATAFVEELTNNQRNALRVILSFDKGCRELRQALNTAKVIPISEDDRKTGLAKLGRTAELFDESLRKPVACDVQPGSRSIDVTMDWT